MSSRQASNDSATVGRLRTAGTIHQAHRRIVENPFVVEPPVFASWIAFTSASLHRTAELFATGQDAQRLSGRAPPRFV
jgi:hypothetical protein